MSIILPKYGMKVPSETTGFHLLGKEFREMGISIESILESFDYNGADPGLVLARMAAQEAALNAAIARIASLETKIANRKFGLTTFPIGTGTPVNGWYWTPARSFAFPTPFPTGTVPVVTLQPQENDGIDFATLVAPPTNTGFTYRVARAAAQITAGNLHWTAQA